MIISFDQLKRVREDHKDERIVLAGGVFDLIHPGHIDLFNRMRAAGDITVVAPSTDRRVRERKGPLRPIHDELTRLTMVDSVRFVDYSLLAPQPIPGLEVPTMQIVEQLRPDIFMTSEASWLNFTGKLAVHGTQIALVPRLNEQVSTTATIEKILTLHS